jgi:hypothetical protein
LSKESANSHSQIDYIQAQIEALKRQRERFERLMIILHHNQQVVDQLTIQYLELWEMKHELGLKLISLPQDERKQLEQTLGSKILEKYESLLDVSFTHLMQEGKILTIEEMKTALAKIDAIIMELITYVNQIQQGKKVAIQSAKDIILKKVLPICFGLALIGADIPLKNLPTMIGGGYIIYTASTA